MKKKLLTGLVATFALSCALGFASCELPFGDPSSPSGEVTTPFKFELVGDSYTITGRGTNDSGMLEFPSEYNGISVTAIGEQAFYNDYDLGKIVVPDSITTIGEGAFYNCVNMTEADLGDGVTAIPKDAFKNCGFLMKFSVPEELESIGESAFSACTKLKKFVMPNTVKSVGKLAFYECSVLANVTFSNTLELIGERAFDRCDALKEVIIPDGAPTVIEKQAFSIAEEHKLHKMSIEKVVLGNSVKSVGYGAFSQNGYIRELVIGDSVTTIGAKAFYKCRRLYSVAVGTKVPTCETSVEENDAGTMVTYTPFTGCEAVREVVDGSNTLREGSSGLGGLLEFVWNVRKPSEESKVSYDEESGLIYYVGNDIPYSGINGTKSAAIIAALLDKFNRDVHVVVPDTYQGVPVLAIADKAFYADDWVKTLDTGANCKYIGYQAFQNVYRLATLYLRESITTIAQNAFLNTTGLTDVYFYCGTNLKSVGESAFRKKKDKTTGAIAGSAYKNIYFKGTSAEWQTVKNVIRGGHDDDTNRNDDLFAKGVTVKYLK